MAGAMQISGLTGFDSASIVKQLMQVERQAGNSLTTGKNTSSSIVSALQQLNGLVNAMKDAADIFKPASLLTTAAWNATTATSSNKDLATVTATGTAQPASLSFTVNSVASAGSVVTDGSVDGTVALNGGAAFQLGIAVGGGAVKVVDIAAGSKISDVVSAINAADAGVRAAMVQVSPGQYRLQLDSKTTGANTGVALTDATGAAPSVLGTTTTLSSGSDTVLRVGGAAGYDVTSPTTTVKDLLPGVSVTAVAADPAKSVTVDVKNDVDGIAAKAGAFVDSVNAVLANISNVASYDKDTKRAGVLNGDSTVRDLKSQIMSVFSGASAGQLADMGVSLTREGKLTFDKAKFTAAYTADPGKVKTTFSDVSSQAAKVGQQATNAADGFLTVRLTGEQRLVQDYTKRIADFNDRMTSKEDMLTRQFSALETMLSKLQSQGQWLAGQLNSLPSASSNK